MTTKAKAKTSPGRPAGRVRSAGKDLEVIKRKKRMLEMRADQGMTYRQIAAVEGISASVCYRQIAEAARSYIEEEDAETVRRLETERIDALIGRWLPSAMGTAKVTVVHDELGPVEIPIPTEQSIKASHHLLALMERKWKWAGLENMTKTAPPVDGMTEKDVNAELWEWIESLTDGSPAE